MTDVPQQSKMLVTEESGVGLVNVTVAGWGEGINRNAMYFPLNFSLKLKVL